MFNPSNRLEIWEQEYSTRKNLPSTITNKPSGALVQFLSNCTNLNKTAALDLGSGNGRNSIYLAQAGFERVIGIEFAKSAINLANEEARRLDLDGKKVEFIHGSVGEKLDYPDNSFDLIIDMMVMHSLDLESRKVMAEEVQRLLRKGGYFLFHTLAAESTEAEALIKNSPGSEPNSYTFEIPDGVIVEERAFTKDELMAMFSKLKLISLDGQKHITKAFGREYERIYYVGVMQKP